NTSFVINTVLFLLVGLQLHGILDRLGGVSTQQLLAGGAAVSAAVVVTRLVWMYFSAYVLRMVPRSVRESGGASPWAVLLRGWIGMRGAVSLAAALALPDTIAGGAPFPQRDVVVFLTFAVIVSTIVVQGMTLPYLVRRLDLHDDGRLEHMEAM